MKSDRHGSLQKWLNAQFDCSVTWKDIEWLRRNLAGKLLIKGILDAEDAIAAAAAGADGVIVSNHGGRQLDTVASGISKLPSVVAAVGDKIEVLMDGSVRSGLDVVKAVSLGARAVMIGRPWVWANAARSNRRGQPAGGVQAGNGVAMALTGVTRVDRSDSGRLIRTLERPLDNGVWPAQTDALKFCGHQAFQQGPCIHRVI